MSKEIENKYNVICLAESAKALSAGDEFDLVYKDWPLMGGSDPVLLAPSRVTGRLMCSVLIEEEQMPDWQDIDELGDLTDDLQRFSRQLSELAERIGLDLQPLNADHISLRCHQNSTAERWRAGFEQCGELYSESEVNGRPICLFKLQQPVCVAGWEFTLIELPWPGEKRYPHEGWEHVEIVLPGPAESLNQRALALLSDDGLLQKGITVKTSAPVVEGERLPNTTFAITDGSVTLKFHPWSLEEIVESERS